MRLIADSGSTKTDWALLDGTSVVVRVRTQGINPFHEKSEHILQVLIEELLPRLGDHSPSVISYYGSGCTAETSGELTRLLLQVFPEVRTVEMESDLMAAARALCGRKCGIACILGTGANSCFYDGKRVVMNTPPLGYILGDEGSGAVLGRLFLNALFKGFLPHWMREDYLQSVNMTYADIIQRVYRQPLANRFLATVVEYVAKHLEVPELRMMVKDNFTAFFQRNLWTYRQAFKAKKECQVPKVAFVGGVAYCFRDILAEVTQQQGYEWGGVEMAPIEGLIRYYTSES